MVFLLVVGVWAATHTEPTSAVSYSSAVAVVVDEAAAAPAGATMTSGPLWADAIFGAVICLLGVLCGLVLITLTVRLLRQAPLRALSRSPRTRIQLTLPGRSHTAVLTLAQLGLSRT